MEPTTNCGLVVLGLVIIYGLPRITRVVLQLVAIVVLTLISILFGFDIPSVRSLVNCLGLPSFAMPLCLGRWARAVQSRNPRGRPRP